ncbi:MAG: hypothetical protein IOD08_03390, partial [Bradyrhizobium sp.]|uniref:hypothetical protein n=1 Tax=Bradyrhizobium sp. TaxID=376 RepID=UPI0025BF6879
MDLPAGRWTFVIEIGDAKGVERQTAVSIPALALDLPLATTRGDVFATLRFALEHQGGELELRFDSPGESWALNALQISDGVGPIEPALSHHRPHNDRWNLPPETPAGSRAILERWRSSLPAESPNFSPTLLSRGDYLDLIESNVGFFVLRQAETGAIIDPDRAVEFQYSTPCFAYAAALTAAERGRPDLVAPAVAAFRKAALDLSRREAADGHEDFYPSPLAHAYRLLERLIDRRLLEEIAAPLRTFDPDATYRKPPGGRGGSGSNWNCKAAAGEYLLFKLGLRDAADYVERSIAAQGWMFDNEFGL